MFSLCTRDIDRIKCLPALSFDHILKLDETALYMCIHRYRSATSFRSIPIGLAVPKVLKVPEG